MGPLAGQMKSTSSAPADGGVAGGAATGAGAGAALAAPGVVCVATGTGGLAGAGAGVGVVLRGASVNGAAAATVVPTGATTRSTWPTSMTFGLSRLFQRTMSRHGWLTSVAIFMMVSPWRTV